MKTEILDVTAGDIADAVARAAQIIEQGGLVVFPTETVYGIACGAVPQAVDRLNRVKSREKTKHYSLHIEDPQKTGQYVPHISAIASRLIRRAWPGPLTIVFELSPGQIQMQRDYVSPESFDMLYRSSTLGIRCVSHPVGQKLLGRCAVPVFAPSANPAGEPPATDAQSAAGYLNGQVDLILDAGPCQFSQSSTVVKAGEESLEVLREGVYSRQEVQEMACLEILFVCTGNTCRSPMAEYLCRKYLSENFHCKIDELEQKGYKILSAGIAATEGMPATAEAVEACRMLGVDASGHRSRQATAEMLDSAELVLTMTQGHLAAVSECIGSSHEKAMMLDEQGIADPIGSGLDVYRETADQILEAIKKKLVRITK